MGETTVIQGQNHGKRVKKTEMILIVFYFLVFGYIIWSVSGRNLLFQPSNPNIKYEYSTGDNCNQGNVIGIEPFMIPVDYSSQKTFELKLDQYLKRTQKLGWINEKTIVVFPEYLGSWLVVVGEKKNVYKTKTIESAMMTMILSNFPVFLKNAFIGKVKSRVEFGLFRMKSPDMAAIYHQTFSSLARKYKITIVAGSIILSSPKITKNKLTVSGDKLFNVTVVYGPNGQPLGLIKKSYLTGSEQPFLASAPQNLNPIIDTPAGKLGVLICADAWYPSVYQQMNINKPSILVVPSYNLVKPTAKWEGYDGNPLPVDIYQNDIKSINQNEAWVKYALAGRMKTVESAKLGIVVCQKGQLWNLKSYGVTTIVERQMVQNIGHVSGACLLNVWKNSL